jgi:hypothetical protein
MSPQLGADGSGLFDFPEVHVILDNLSFTKKNDRWLKRHANVHFDFTPTGSSWLNPVEIFSSEGKSLHGAPKPTCFQVLGCFHGGKDNPWHYSFPRRCAVRACE